MEEGEEGGQADETAVAMDSVVSRRERPEGLRLTTWGLAALIVALVLLVAAAVVGAVGKKKVAAAGPPKPELALGGLKEDIQTVKGNHHG